MLEWHVPTICAAAGFGAARLHNRKGGGEVRWGGGLLQGGGAHLVRVCTLKVQSDHMAAAMGCSAPPSPLAASSSALRPSSASACAASHTGDVLTGLAAKVSCNSPT